MRISDWSSDVCSSDLIRWVFSSKWARMSGLVLRDMKACNGFTAFRAEPCNASVLLKSSGRSFSSSAMLWPTGAMMNSVAASAMAYQDRKSVVLGKRVSVRVDLVGGRILKQKKH